MLIERSKTSQYHYEQSGSAKEYGLYFKMWKSQLDAFSIKWYMVKPPWSAKSEYELVQSIMNNPLIFDEKLDE